MADRNLELVAWVQLERAVLEQSGPDLRAAEVLEDGDRASLLVRGGADPLDHLAMALMGAVGKIQPADIDAGGNEVPDSRFTARSGADGRHDFRVPHTASLQ